MHSFQAYEPVTIGSLSITAFPKFHDASDPHSFIVTGNNIHIGVFTDIGSTCDHVITHFKKCHAAFLESNYCEDMLANGSYPEFLKKRISGDNGHLSNTQALELFLKHKSSHLSHLILSHLSKNNNSMKLVEQLFSNHAGSTQIIVASRYKETAVYCIEEMQQRHIPKKKINSNQSQLSLF